MIYYILNPYPEVLLLTTTCLSRTGGVGLARRARQPAHAPRVIYILYIYVVYMPV